MRGIQRTPLLVVAVLAASLLYLVPAGHAAPRGARKGGKDGTITAAELGARLQMRVVDAGNTVTLAGPLVTVRLYPGTRNVSIVGDSHVLKDRLFRRGQALRLPARPVAFLSKQILAKRREILAHRRSYRLSPQPRPGSVTLAFKSAAKGPRSHAARDWKPLDRTPLAVRPARRPAAPRLAAARAGWAPRVADRAWKYIVVHHSDDSSGDAAKYDRHHREVNGWDSLGYHFVIGNGSLSGDGEVEIGPRWPVQKHGAHARNHSLGDNRYNEQGIGVCLVGAFDEGGERPTQRQLDELVRLTQWLMQRYRIPASRVLRHCDACTTNCPGRHFPWAAYMARLR